MTDSIHNMPAGKLLVNTLNAWSFVLAQKDEFFSEALRKGGELIPDGKSIVWAAKFLKIPNAPRHRFSGWDLFVEEMEQLQDVAQRQQQKKKVMFVGSTDKVLSLIKERAYYDFPSLEIVTYSPPFKEEFSSEDDEAMITAINQADPDLLWIGMTAPKQEKWAYKNWDKLNIHCHCGTIGAVFDFYAGTVRRAPEWMQKAGLEWLHRLCSDPKRLWRRYLFGNIQFVYLILKEKIKSLF